MIVTRPLHQQQPTLTVIGLSEGISDGSFEGIIDGIADGAYDGLSDGLDDGYTEGKVDTPLLGANDFTTVGAFEPEGFEDSEGDSLGLSGM